MAKYSRDLIEKTILCFKQEDGLKLSNQMAEEYLDNLANLFIAFSECHRDHDQCLSTGVGSAIVMKTEHENSKLHKVVS